MKKPTSVDKSKGKEINVIVSAKSLENGQNEGKIEGWLKIQKENCNGANEGSQSQGGNENISIFKDFRNSS